MKGFKKMGLMFLALVIALAGIGVGYASWTDTLEIQGTVNTGSVDLDIVAVSGTYVYKDLTLTSPGQYGTEIDVDYWQTEPGDLFAPTPDDTATRWLVAQAYAMSPVLRPFGAPENYAVMHFKNLFPSIVFKADVKIHYAGLIPAKVDGPISYEWDVDGPDDWVQALIDSNNIVGFASIYDSLDADRIGEVVDDGYQLHYCDTIIIELWIHIPQDDVYESRSATATATLDVIQWNEYGMPD